MNPLLLPPRLLLRALDDLHTLARGASIVERADRMDERAGTVDRLPGSRR